VDTESAVVGEVAVADEDEVMTDLRLEEKADTVAIGG
jgi:hypothetical protein